MTFKVDHFTDYDDPQLNLYALRDSLGTPFLLLAGMEPDLQWGTVCHRGATAGRAARVRRTVGLGAIPMAVPHTRPVTMTPHSNNRELDRRSSALVGEVQVPSSASNLLEFRMAQHGHESVGFTVHVLHLPVADRLPGRRRGAAAAGRRIGLAAASCAGSGRGGRRARQNRRTGRGLPEIA